MTTNRTPMGRPPSSNRITPEMVELFKRACALSAKCDTWESEGGTRRQFLDASRDLHSMMGRYPHQECVCDVNSDDTPPSWMASDARRCADFRLAVMWRRKLEAAAQA
jgi:hypothetical protein